MVLLADTKFKNLTMITYYYMGAFYKVPAGGRMNLKFRNPGPCHIGWLGR